MTNTRATTATRRIERNGPNKKRPWWLFIDVAIYIKRGTWTRTRGRDEEALAVIELICQFVNYTDEFVWWLRYAYVSPCVSSAFIDRKWIVECFYTCVHAWKSSWTVSVCSRVSLCTPCTYAPFTLVFKLCMCVRVCVCAACVCQRTSVRGIGHT